MDIKVPHRRSTLTELQETWQDLLLLDRMNDQTILGEVLQAFGQEQPSHAPPCPFKEDSEQYLKYCAAAYAEMIGASSRPSRARRLEVVDVSVEELQQIAREERAESRRRPRARRPKS